MATKKTNKKGRIQFDKLFLSISVLAFTATFFLYFISQIFIKSYNINLNSQIASTKNQITVVKSEVDSLNVTIKGLTDYDRVVNMINVDTDSRNTTVITLGD